MELVYEYKKISDGVDVKYVDQVTGAEIADTEHKNGLEKDNYTTEPKEIPGYELVKTPTNKNGEMTVELITVTYEYRLLSDVTTKHIDANTGKEIVDAVVETYKEGDAYTTTAKDLVGYILTKSPEVPNGTMGREDIEVVYEYKMISDGLIVKYIDEITGEINKKEEEDFSVFECIIKWLLNILCFTYVILVYGGVLFICVSVSARKFSDPALLPGVIAAMIPTVIISVISLIFIIVFRKKISRERLLSRTLFIKFSLMPLYIMGGILIAMSLLLTISPVVIMIFVGPTVAITLAVIGWVLLVCSSVYSVPCIIKLFREGEGVVSKALCVFSIVAQYCYVLDVVSIIMLAIKENKGKEVKHSLLAIVAVVILGMVVLSIAEIFLR